LHIAIASLDARWEDKAASFARSRELAARAAACGARLVAFPEMTLTGFTMNATSVAEPAADSPTIRGFSALARELGIAIAFGVVLEGRERPTNCLVVVDEAGRELVRYAKLHLFSPGGEDQHYESGDRLASVALDDVVFGLSICYDIRFPELFSALSPLVHAHLVMASWPEQRLEHWYALLQARAIESQAYVVGVNRTGADGLGQAHPASSYVFDPAGKRLEPEWEETELAGYRINAAAVEELRRRFPVLRDRRPDLYRAALASEQA
jgi:omega-amidase